VFDNLRISRSGATVVVERKLGRFGESLQDACEVLYAGAGIAVGCPSNEIQVRRCRTHRPRVALISRKYMLEDQGVGSTVDDTMVDGPYEAPVLLRQLEHRNSHQWSVKRIDALVPVTIEELGKPFALLRLGAPAPVFEVEWHLCARAYSNLRLIGLGPAELEAQRIKAVEGALPCRSESLRLQRFL
jgi:hypothetical protein